MTKSLINEEWRTSISLPDYEVSSLGRVKRKSYESKMPNGGVRKYGDKPHYGFDSKKSMTFVYKGKTYKVHQLVCEAFNGSKPFDSAVVMHLDENYKNNEYSNLKWGTQKENMNAPGFIEYCKNRNKHAPF